MNVLRCWFVWHSPVEDLSFGMFKAPTNMLTDKAIWCSPMPPPPSPLPPPSYLLLGNNPAVSGSCVGVLRCQLPCCLLLVVLTLGGSQAITNNCVNLLEKGKHSWYYRNVWGGVFFLLGSTSFWIFLKKACGSIWRMRRCRCLFDLEGTSHSQLE